MPQARSNGSSSESSSSGSSGAGRPSRSTSSRPSRSGSTGTRSTGTGRTTRSSSAGTSNRARSSRAAGAGPSRASSAASDTANAADARVEAMAQRVRRLNERIIEAGKDAGEATLSSYEKALKAIAASIERGPGKSDVEWISALATTQAKFLRDVTNAWTSAARGMLK
jgi:hypothetical protein